MWLVLCDASDGAGLWTAAGLRRLGLEPVEVLLPEELAGGTALTQRVGGGGDEVRITLPDGRPIEGGTVRGVVNRLPALPPGRWRELPPGDRDYVGEELLACLAGLFAGLACPILNPPGPLGLSGPAHSEAEWRVMAGRAGLETVPLHLTSWADPPRPDAERALVVVAGDRVLGAPDRIAEGCRALALSAGTPLLGIGFAIEGEGRWLMEQATAQPDLRSGGRPALEALAEALDG